MTFLSDPTEQSPRRRRRWTRGERWWWKSVWRRSLNGWRKFLQNWFPLKTSLHQLRASTRPGEIIIHITTPPDKLLDTPALFFIFYMFRVLVKSMKWHRWRYWNYVYYSGQSSPYLIKNTVKYFKIFNVTPLFAHRRENTLFTLKLMNALQYRPQVGLFLMKTLCRLLKWKHLKNESVKKV